MYDAADQAQEPTPTEQGPSKIVSVPTQRKAEAQPQLKNQSRQITAFLLMLFLAMIWTDPKDLHGTAKVHPKLKRDASLTAWIITISTGINTLGLAPYLWLSSGLLAVPMLLMINGGSNILGVIAARRLKGNRIWSGSGLFLFLSLNVFLTGFTAPGTLLFSGSSQVEEEKAREVVNAVLSQQTATLKRLTGQQSPQLEQVNREIAQAEAVLARLQNRPAEENRQNPEWLQAMRRLEGEYALKDLPLKQKLQYSDRFLLARRADLLEQQQKLFTEATRNLSILEISRDDYGSDKAFLQAKLPKHYQAHFRTTSLFLFYSAGNLRSGFDAAGTANKMILDYWQRGNWTQLGFPLILGGLSLIFSAAACTLVLGFSIRPDTQDSHDPEFQLQLMRAIARLRRDNQNQNS
jgi:hypothetical protein